jgi:hypothetical protein
MTEYGADGTVKEEDVILKTPLVAKNVRFLNYL